MAAFENVAFLEAAADDAVLLPARSTQFNK
jgi:hypothetical protein